MSVKVVVLASGAGSTFAAIADASQKKVLSCELISLIVSKADCGAIAEAKQRNINFSVIDPTTFDTREESERELLRVLKALHPDWIVLAGYTQLLSAEIVKTFARRIVNTHPSLLPKYGGQGMYGRRVHEAVLRAKENETGITVHLVTEKYDEGPIVAQKKIPVLPNDNVQSLSRRVQDEEKNFYIQSLGQLFIGK